MNQVRLLIAGGGTGGHLFPGVALAEELRERHPNAEILFVGTKQGIESRVLSGLGWSLETIEISGLKTVGALGAIRGALRIPGALWQSRRIVKKFNPNVVIGVGGYSSGPVVMAARSMGISCAILEQNSIPGLTNTWLSKLVHRIFLSFSHSQEFFPKNKCKWVGNPIRKQILTALQEQRSIDKKPDKDNPSSKGLRLFIFGGSQGATSVNQMCCEALGVLSERKMQWDIVHQTGKANLEETKARYGALGIRADCRAFIDNMAEEYAKADVIVARAGATTIAELAIVGRPAILIPYPFAANNHQEKNALEMVESEAAWMLQQDGNNDGKALASYLSELYENEDKRKTMSLAMKAFGRPDAAKEVIDWIATQVS